MPPRVKIETFHSISITIFNRQPKGLLGEDENQQFVDVKTKISNARKSKQAEDFEKFYVREI